MVFHPSTRFLSLANRLKIDEKLIQFTWFKIVSVEQSMKPRELLAQMRHFCEYSILQFLNIYALNSMGLLTLTLKMTIFLLNSLGENERKILTLPVPGSTPVPLAHQATATPRGGLANHKNFLLIYTCANGESRLIRAPCRTRALSSFNCPHSFQL